MAYDKRVNTAGTTPGKFLSARTTKFAAGPPLLANVGGAVGVGAAATANGGQMFYPLGVVQSFGLGQNMDIRRIFEFGSDRSLFISGHTVGQIQLGRTMYHGPSLLRSLYAYYQDLIPPTVIQSLYNSPAITNPNPHMVRIPPGYENMFINLASDLFSQPVGLMMTIQDTEEDNYQSAYFEHVLIPNHNLSGDSQGVVLQESLALQYERIIPIFLRLIGLILP